MPREVLHGTRVFEREQVRGTEEGRGGLGVIMGERGCLRVVGGSGCVGGLGVIMGKRRYLIITHRDISYLNNMILQHIPYLYITIIHIPYLYITIIHIPYLYITIIHITHLLIITLIPIHQPSHATHLLALTLLHSHSSSSPTRRTLRNNSTHRRCVSSFPLISVSTKYTRFPLTTANTSPSATDGFQRNNETPPGTANRFITRPVISSTTRTRFHDPLGPTLPLVAYRYIVATRVHRHRTHPLRHLRQLRRLRRREGAQLRQTRQLGQQGVSVERQLALQRARRQIEVETAFVALADSRGVERDASETGELGGEVVGFTVGGVGGLPGAFLGVGEEILLGRVVGLAVGYGEGERKRPLGSGSFGACSAAGALARSAPSSSHIS